jgi:hypothetical protein
MLSAASLKVARETDISAISPRREGGARTASQGEQLGGAGNAPHSHRGPLQPEHENTILEKIFLPLGYKGTISKKNPAYL